MEAVAAVAACAQLLDQAINTTETIATFCNRIKDSLAKLSHLYNDTIFSGVRGIEGVITPTRSYPIYPIYAIGLIAPLRSYLIYIIGVTAPTRYYPIYYLSYVLLIYFKNFK